MFCINVRSVRNGPIKPPIVLLPWSHCYCDHIVTVITLLPWSHCYCDHIVTGHLVTAVCLAVDGVWTSWTDWGICSEWCNNGTQNRTRQCVGPFYGGLGCPGEPEQIQDCFLKYCPSRCQLLCPIHQITYTSFINIVVDISEKQLTMFITGERITLAQHSAAPTYTSYSSCHHL